MRAVCFGEIMMRLNPEGYKRIRQSQKLCCSYAGGEANVAVSLAGYGIDAAFVTKVPAHEVGQSAIDQLRQFGVDTKEILRGGPRLGVYFVEKGASQRPSKVIYDRAGSSWTWVLILAVTLLSAGLSIILKARDKKAYPKLYAAEPEAPRD